MANFHFTNKAVKDLTDIWNYTYDTWSESQADVYYQILMDACNKIANKPDIGKSYENITSELLGFKAGKHIIFYQVFSSNNIEITRILHERMDLKNRIR